MLEFIKKWKFLGLILLLILLLLLGRSCGGSETVSPVEGAAQEGSQSAASVGGFFANLFDFSTKNELQTEIDNLNKELAEVKTQGQISGDIAEENEELRELLDLKNSYTSGWATIAAEVTGREADNWYEKLTINKGSKDGISENMAVVDQNGLLGKIVNVTENTSEVLLIIDSAGSLGGMLQKSSIQGVLQGIGGGKGLINMTKLPYNADIQLNDVVITSGVGGVFPAGLLVGTVVKVNTSADGLSKEAIIQPYADFNDIQFVLVVHPSAKTETADDDTDDDTKSEDNGDSAADDGEDTTE